jgi:hypothetical protein
MKYRSVRTGTTLSESFSTAAWGVGNSNPWHPSSPDLKTFDFSFSFSEISSGCTSYVEQRIFTTANTYLEMVCNVRFEVFTAVTMKNAVFWDITPCSFCKNGRLGGT